MKHKQQANANMKKSKKIWKRLAFFDRLYQVVRIGGFGIFELKSFQSGIKQFLLDLFKLEEVS